jgi:tetratricopeptide (TPR) repeat protein
MGRRGLAVLLALAALTLGSVPAWPAAHAGSTDDTDDEAKRLYALGTQLYDQGHYDEAIVQFKAGAELHPDPAFDFDIARCYQKLGQADDERTYLEKVIKEAPPTFTALGEAKKDLQALGAKAPVAAKPSASAATPDTSAGPASGASPLGAWIATGSATALLGAAVIFGAAGSSAADSLHSMASRTPQETSEDLTSVHRDYLVANLTGACGLISAGLAGWFWVRYLRSSSTQVAATPLPGGMAVVVSGVLPSP